MSDTSSLFKFRGPPAIDMAMVKALAAMPAIVRDRCGVPLDMPLRGTNVIIMPDGKVLR